jgi:hypothetical protein
MDRPAVVSIRLTTECWWFVDEARSWPALIPLPGDVQEVLDRMPHMEVSGGVPEPLLVGRMTRPQAEAVQLLAERGVRKAACPAARSSPATVIGLAVVGPECSRMPAITIAS